MKSPVPIIFLIFLASCQSVPDKVKANKNKYIQVAKENSKPVDVSNLTAIYEQAKKNNTECKLKYLGVDNIQTVYESVDNSEIKLDSIVIFTKKGYLVFYDFAMVPRDIEIVKEKNNLKDFQKIDARLFIGKK